MPGELPNNSAPRGAFLRALARDVRGNTLAIMAAALIPLAGLIGGGIDISRMYITKTRLQHACDAGALAGRKAMGGGVWGSGPNAVAQQFFDANYQTGAYGSFALTRSFSENAGKVTGTASATLPMTLMRVLGKTSDTLATTCDAEMRLPNTDVMFVLDVTGSMNCVAGDANCSNNGGVPANGSKIDGLKTAVKCFYEIVARLPTNASCATAKPSGGTGGQVQIRFGFVPYASNVNVGYLLPSSYFASNWKYQSRERNGTSWGSWTHYSYTAKTSGNCVNPYTNTATRQWRSVATGSNGSNACDVQYSNGTPLWHYGQIATDISALKNGSGWNGSLTLPLNNDGSNRTITWDGCIEERQTVRATSYDPIPSGAKDLNIDLMPSPSDTTTLWAPALPDLIYLRQITNSYSQANVADIPATTTNNFLGVDDYCPTTAKKLQSWTDPSTFSSYVDSLVAQGNTYHDIGMLWGARLMSPTGIFASENATTPLGADIQRNLIFMTDGDSTGTPCDYNAYGVPFFDQRQSTDVGSANVCGSNRQQLIDQINLRLEGLCTAVKNMNITLWVVSYGGTLNINQTTEDRLKNCASSGKYFSASDPAKLQTTFASIANQISALRLTK